MGEDASERSDAVPECAYEGNLKYQYLDGDMMSPNCNQEMHFRPRDASPEENFAAYCKSLNITGSSMLNYAIIIFDIKMKKLHA